MRTVYLILAALGAILPYAFFLRFMMSETAGPGHFVSQLFATAPAGGFTTDLLISSMVFWIWSFDEARRLHMPRWWGYVLVNLLVGLSCALPLFFWARAGHVSGVHRREGDT